MARRRSLPPSRVLSDALEGCRHRAPAAEAQGRQAVATLATLELVQEGGHDPCATRPDRMAECDRPAVHVDLAPVEPELAAVGERLGGERLVDLNEIECLERQLDPVQE